VSGPVTNALFAPPAASFTACPAAHDLSADWIADVSRLLSLGTPPEVTF
jgi:hypothetical protein